jgi:hypothetical protein
MSCTKTELESKQARYIELRNDFTQRWLDTMITKAGSPREMAAKFREMEPELRNLMTQGMLDLVLIHLNVQLLSYPQAPTPQLEISLLQTFDKLLLSQKIYEAIWSVHLDLRNKMQEELMISSGFRRLTAKAEASKIIDSTLDWTADNIRQHLNASITTDLLRGALRPKEFAEQFAAKHTTRRRVLLRQS